MLRPLRRPRSASGERYDTPGSYRHFRTKFPQVTGLPASATRRPRVGPSARVIRHSDDVSRKGYGFRSSRWQSLPCRWKEPLHRPVTGTGPMPGPRPGAPGVAAFPLPAATPAHRGSDLPGDGSEGSHHTTCRGTSRAVGRVLSRAAVAGRAVTVIHLGWPLPTTSSALPVCSGGPPSNAHCLGLLRMGFTEPTWSPRPLVVSYTTVSPLPLPPVRTGRSGGLFSVALSRGSPRVGVGHHPALRSPDLPRRWLPTDATVRPTRPPPSLGVLRPG